LISALKTISFQVFGFVAEPGVALGVVVDGSGFALFLVTVKPALNASFPDGFLTPTNLDPAGEWGPMVILTVIVVSLVTVKLFTLIARPNDTPVAPVKLVPLIVTVNVSPWLAVFGLTPVIIAPLFSTVNPAFITPFPEGAATPTNLEPAGERGPMVILAVMAVSLVTVKLFTLIARPKDTPVAPVKFVPLIVTVSVSPWPA